MDKRLGNNESSVELNASEPGARLPYERPVLRSWGSVEHRTELGGYDGADGDTMASVEGG